MRVHQPPPPALVVVVVVVAPAVLALAPPRLQALALAVPAQLLAVVQPQLMLRLGLKLAVAPPPVLPRAILSEFLKNIDFLFFPII